MSGRLIIDNILLSSEVFHFINHNHAKKKGYMAMKLDMSKAYDRVKWDFLACVMAKMGFPSIWIDRVMACVKFVTYSFLVNGIPIDVVIPSRGLRQGDPISPYIFLLCFEGLGALIKRAISQGVLHGISVARKAPRLSGVCFPPLSLFRGKRLTLRSEKCEVSFNKSLEVSYRRKVSSILGIKEVHSHHRYLGLPTIFMRSKRFSFSNLRDRIWKNLQGWKEKLLSKAGKEVLIKVVDQSIPTYAMSCFKLPASFCNEVTSIIRNFWWGTTNSERGIPWKAWKKICRSKYEGSLSFRDLENFNLAHLAKHFWRLLIRMIYVHFIP